MKPVRLSEHAKRYLSKRGFTVAEVEEAIRSAPWSATEFGVATVREQGRPIPEPRGKLAGA